MVTTTTTTTGAIPNPPSRTGVTFNGRDQLSTDTCDANGNTRNFELLATGYLIDKAGLSVSHFAKYTLRTSSMRLETLVFIEKFRNAPFFGNTASAALRADLCQKADNVRWLNMISAVGFEYEESIDALFGNSERGLSAQWKVLRDAADGIYTSMREALASNGVVASRDLSWEVLPLSWMELVFRIVLEAEYQDVVKPLFFLETIYPVFEKGRAPVGWEGDMLAQDGRLRGKGLPAGRLVLFEARKEGR